MSAWIAPGDGISRRRAGLAKTAARGTQPTASVGRFGWKTREEKQGGTPMDTGMQGKIALVTGAAGDIGRAVARVFAAEGARLALLDLDKEGLDALASQLRDGGAVVSAACVDLSMPEEAIAGIEAVLAPYGGRIDVLINNAGICPAFQI